MSLLRDSKTQFAAFYDRHAGHLYRWLLTLLRDEASAQEVLTAVFHEAWTLGFWLDDSADAGVLERAARPQVEQVLRARLGRVANRGGQDHAGSAVWLPQASELPAPTPFSRPSPRAKSPRQEDRF